MRAHIRDTWPRDGPAVLLIHGFGSSLHTWEASTLLLEDRFRVVSLDLPGFGLTGPDPTGDFADETRVAVLRRLIGGWACPAPPPCGHAPFLSAGPMTASLVGTSGFAAIPTTALDLPLVQRLRRQATEFQARILPRNKPKCA